MPPDEAIESIAQGMLVELIPDDEEGPRPGVRYREELIRGMGWDDLHIGDCRFGIVSSTIGNWEIVGHEVIRGSRGKGGNDLSSLTG